MNVAMKATMRGIVPIEAKTSALTSLKVSTVDPKMTGMESRNE